MLWVTHGREGFDLGEVLGVPRDRPALRGRLGATRMNSVETGRPSPIRPTGPRLPDPARVLSLTFHRD